jgi:hypothetical protein
MVALTGQASTAIGEDAEVYTVRDRVWAEAGMRANGGCLRVGCLEKRLGRKLRPQDFEPGNALNRPELPCTPRLRERRDGKPWTPKQASKALADHLSRRGQTQSRR